MFLFVNSPYSSALKVLVLLFKPENKLMEMRKRFSKVLIYFN